VPRWLPPQSRPSSCVSPKGRFQRGLLRVGAEAIGVAARLYAPPIAVAIKWRLSQRIPASVWSRGNSRCGHRVIGARVPSSAHQNLQAAPRTTSNNTPLFVHREEENPTCCSTTHNACSDYGRGGGDGGAPRGVLSNGPNVVHFEYTPAGTPSRSRLSQVDPRLLPRLPKAYVRTSLASAADVVCHRPPWRLEVRRSSSVARSFWSFVALAMSKRAPSLSRRMTTGRSDCSRT
jgi:hypothetical protein